MNPQNQPVLTHPTMFDLIKTSRKRKREDNENENPQIRMFKSKTVGKKCFSKGRYEPDNCPADKRPPYRYDLKSLNSKHDEVKLKCCDVKMEKIHSNLCSHDMHQDTYLDKESENKVESLHQSEKSSEEKLSLYTDIYAETNEKSVIRRCDIRIPRLSTIPDNEHDQQQSSPIKEPSDDVIGGISSQTCDTNNRRGNQIFPDAKSIGLLFREVDISKPADLMETKNIKTITSKDVKAQPQVVMTGHLQVGESEAKTCNDERINVSQVGAEEIHFKAEPLESDIDEEMNEYDSRASRNALDKLSNEILSLEMEIEEEDEEQAKVCSTSKESKFRVTSIDAQIGENTVRYSDKPYDFCIYGCHECDFLGTCILIHLQELYFWYRNYSVQAFVIVGRFFSIHNS